MSFNMGTKIREFCQDFWILDEVLRTHIGDFWRTAE